MRRDVVERTDGQRRIGDHVRDESFSFRLSDQSLLDRDGSGVDGWQRRKKEEREPFSFSAISRPEQCSLSSLAVPARS